VVTEAAAAGGVQAATPAMAEALAAALETVFAKYGGMPVRERPFRFWQAYAYVVTAAGPIHMDLPILRNRRAVVLVNSDPANAVWYGPTASVRVNNGGFLTFGGAPVSLPLDENCQVWAIAAAGAPVISAIQLGD
jgi:hypothetical protein